LPTDAEWCTLENYVDAGTVSCSTTGWRGYDAGYHLKSTTGWYNNGNGDDSFGFTALPGGYRYYGGGFNNLGKHAYFWSSSEYSGSHAWYRILNCYNDGVVRHYTHKTYGFSVRCLQD